MLFSITWKMFDNTKLDCYRAFMAMTPEDDVADAGKGVTIVGRWHTIGNGSGVCIAETDDVAALNSWTGRQWISPRSKMGCTPLLQTDSGAQALKSLLWGTFPSPA